MTRPLSRSEMETWRLQAATLLLSGMRQAEVRRKFRARGWPVTRATVSRWARTLQAGGSLKLHPTTGRPSRLAGWQKDELREWLQANLDRARKMKGREIRDWIAARFGVTYNPNHIGRLAKQLLANNNASQERKH